MQENKKFEMPKIKFIKADSEDIIQTSGLMEGEGTGATPGEENIGGNNGSSIFGFNKKFSNGFYV